MKHIKMLGLVALSAMALMALLGTASASASSFTAGMEGQALNTNTLVQHVFKITGSEVKCNVTKFNGVTEGNKTVGSNSNIVHGESQKVHPVYESCEAFGFNTGVSINTTGCDYTFSANTTSGMGDVKVIDHAGETCNGIVITADPPFTTCTAVVAKQTIASAVSYTNSGSAVKVKATATGISTNVTASNGLCPLTTGAHTGAAGGNYNGESQVNAELGVNYTE